MHITISAEDRQNLQSALQAADKHVVRIFLERLT